MAYKAKLRKAIVKHPTIHGVHRLKIRLETLRENFNQFLIHQATLSESIQDLAKLYGLILVYVGEDSRFQVTQNVMGGIL